MPRLKVLLEVEVSTYDAFSNYGVASASDVDCERQCDRLLERVAGLGVEGVGFAPIPMFTAANEFSSRQQAAIASFRSDGMNPDFSSASSVIAVEFQSGSLNQVASRPGVRVWPNSSMHFPEASHLVASAISNRTAEDESVTAIDLARSKPGVDSIPFAPGVEIDIIRELLGVQAIWQDGFRGQNVAVGLLDEGVNGIEYPVTGGANTPGHSPGSASIESHGSMCAAGVLLAAPMAQIYDYSFIGNPNSGGALAMFQGVLEQRRVDGTPHLTSNSYSYFGFPARSESPNHEVWDLGHPLNRKVREVVASGAPCIYAAGNCGADLPHGRCQVGAIGPGASIHGANSLAEVITVAAVNSRHARIGYSSQGPGMFAHDKPDVACYSHYFGNFGDGRPGGTLKQPFDDGTSAAAPVAAGVAACLLSAFPDLVPSDLRTALIRGAVRVGSDRWTPDYGYGVVNAASAYSLLKRHWRND